MGLFGGIFKAVGKLAGGALKAVASKATGGLSDSILKALKGRNDAKKAAQAAQYNLQQLALAEKQAPLQPKVRSTEKALDDAVSGTPAQWNPGYNDPYGRRRVRYGAKRARELLMGGPDWPDEEPLERPRRRARSPAKARSAAKRTPAAPKRRGARAVPKGGLDLKAISALWRSQGKPGTWQDFIKANSHLRV